MSYSNKHLVEAYTGLFEGLSPISKIELIESLSKSLKTGSSKKEIAFYKSFGALGQVNPFKEKRTKSAKPNAGKLHKQPK